MKLFTLGYTGLKLPALQALAERENLVVVDTRFQPRSRAPQWNRGRLQDALGARYAWVRAFGNVNYKGGPIALVNLDEGIGHVERVLELGYDGVLLLCMCADIQTCHRRVVSEALEQHFGVEAVHLAAKDLGDGSPPAPPVDWSQLGLL